MKATTTIESEVKAVLNQMADAYMQRDMDGLLSLFAPDSDVVMYGTGVDEKRVGLDQIRAQAERDWAQSEYTAMRYDWMAISAAGPVAWVAADISFTATFGGQSMSFMGRLTSVLEKRDGQWLIVQSHFSFPTPEQAEGDSFPG